MGRFALDTFLLFSLFTIYMLKVCFVDIFQWNMNLSDVLIDVTNLSGNTTETLFIAQFKRSKHSSPLRYGICENLSF